MVNVLKLALFNAVALPVTFLLSFAAAAVSGWAEAVRHMTRRPSNIAAVVLYLVLLRAVSAVPATVADFWPRVTLMTMISALIIWRLDKWLE